MLVCTHAVPVALCVVLSMGRVACLCCRGHGSDCSSKERSTHGVVFPCIALLCM